eukprot:c12229_g1_i1 orf=3-185(-)
MYAQVLYSDHLITLGNHLQQEKEEKLQHCHFVDFEMVFVTVPKNLLSMPSSWQRHYDIPTD